MKLFVYVVPGIFVATGIFFGIFFIPDKTAAANCILVTTIVAVAFGAFVKRYVVYPNH
ncbi:MAG: hypothetical protein ABIK07_20910 [Planctomycetota bacterium]